MSLETRPAPALPPPLRTLLEGRLFGGELDLPMLPDTSAEVMSLCNEENCDARQLSDLIERDQSLAGHVLRVANSAAYAPKEPIVSLQQAVSRLGSATVCEIAIAVSLKGEVFSVPGWGVQIRTMWIHSAATAVYAKEVARSVRKNVEAAFLGGLLHDVGRPLVLKELVALAAERTDRPVPPPLVEAATDEYHETVGGLLIERWGLPDWIQGPVAHHHEPSAAGEHVEEARIIRLADLLCHWALDHKAREEDFPTEDPVLGELDLYADDLVELFEKRGRVIEVAEAFL